jgi:hypothetical protein
MGNASHRQKLRSRIDALIAKHPRVARTCRKLFDNEHDSNSEEGSPPTLGIQSKFLNTLATQSLAYRCQVRDWRVRPGMRAWARGSISRASSHERVVRRTARLGQRCSLRVMFLTWGVCAYQMSSRTAFQALHRARKLRSRTRLTVPTQVNSWRLSHM